MEQRSLLHGHEVERAEESSCSSDIVQTFLLCEDYRGLAKLDCVELVPFLVTKLNVFTDRERVIVCAKLLQRDPDAQVSDHLKQLCSNEVPEIAILATCL